VGLVFEAGENSFRFGVAVTAQEAHVALK